VLPTSAENERVSATKGRVLKKVRNPRYLRTRINMDTARSLPPIPREHERTGRIGTDEAAGLSTTWNDLDENGGVLEIHEHGVHLTLSLFLVVPFAGARASSWWTTDDGAWLGTAHVGLA
jgi:hypothetical protein